MIQSYFKSRSNDKTASAKGEAVVKYEKWSLLDYFRANVVLQHRIEEKLFEFLTNKISLEFKYVYIKNGTQRMWTASANTHSENIPIVLVHGLCGAIGLWVHNMDSLGESNPLYAFDLPGFGRSSRPKFNRDPVLAEKEFTDAIEEWRQMVGLEKMILIGHSFGGFLVTSYALQYPERVAALVLADPWGFAEKDSSIRHSLWIRMVLKMSRYWSPFSIVRVSGPFGLKLLKKYRPDIGSKFMTLLGENTDIIYDYIWHVNREVPSGEDGFRSIADEVYFYAKRPMIKRIENLDQNIAVCLIQGRNSSVDCNVGDFIVKSLQISRVSVKIIDNAGHHVHADQPELFNQCVKEIINTVQQQLNL